MPGSELDPVSSPLFATWTDPESGVPSYLLEAPPFAATRTFPATHPVATTDGRSLWTAAETSAGAEVLGLIDAAAGAVEAVAPSEGAAVPAVDRDSGRAFLAVGLGVYRAEPDGELRPVGHYGSGGGTLVAGLTVSADGDRVLGVVERDGNWAVTSLHRPTGSVDVWHSGGRAYGTVLCSPGDPTVVFLAGPTGTASDPGETGAAWLAREGLGARPVSRLLPSRHRGHWWNRDGAGLWYVEPGTGVGRVDLESGHAHTAWRAPRAIRAHATSDGALIAASLAGADRRRLSVHDPATDATVDVASSLPATPGVAVNPQFVAGDAYLAYTTGVRGRPRVALTPTAALRDAL